MIYASNFQSVRDTQSAEFEKLNEHGPEEMEMEEEEEAEEGDAHLLLLCPQVS